MPSLTALHDFRSSFNDIANERKNVNASGMPFDELTLPTTEPPPFNPDIHVAASDDFSLDDFSASGASPEFDIGAFLNDLPGEVSPPPMDDFLNSLGIEQTDTPPMDDFFNNLGVEKTESPPTDDFLDNLGAGQTDSLPMDDFFNSLGVDQTESPPAEDSDPPQTDDFSDNLETESSDLLPMDDFFSNLGVDQTDPPADDFSNNAEFEPSSPDETNQSTGDDSDAEESPTDNFGDLDFGSFENLDGSADNIDTNENDFPGAIDLGGESLNDDSFNTESAESTTENTMDDFSFPDIDLSNAANENDFESSGDPTYTDDTISADSIDLGGESLESSVEPEVQRFDDESDAEERPLPLDSDFSMGDILPDTDFSSIDFSTSGGEEDSTPEGDSGLEDFGADFSSDTLDLGSGDSSPDTSSETNIDFDIPGLENIFEKEKKESFIQPPPRRKLFGRKKTKAEASEDDGPVEEIALKQEDVDKLLRTLSLYPLNLRIICQELIAEQVILPQQLSKLIRLLVNGAHALETAAHCEQITGKPVIIPRSWEKSTGAAFEAEQSSFAYIFVHNFLPVLRIFAVIAALAASVFYLSYTFIYVPLRAESIYARGYERISEGEYQRANELFQQAFDMHRKKKWFYSYAEAFRDHRRYMLAEGKYDELLRFFPLDKKGVLDYANLNTYYLLNYDKANNILNINLLNFAPNDYEGLLASGDNFMAWADSDPSRYFGRYEDARFAYARLLELRGWQVPIVERMLKYFIATDNLRETLNLRVWFESNNRRRLTTETLAQLGGYLLDKQLEQPAGLPNPYVENIESVRAMLLQAVREKPEMPEPHYHLARYYNSLGSTRDERLTLENAIRAFELARTESVPQRLMHVDTRFRYSNILTNNREFFPAEEQLIKGIELYEEFLTRNLIHATPQLGELYASIGDLEYYTKTGDRIAAQGALNNYHAAERYGYAPPEMQYRMGSAYYQLEDWGNSLDYLFKAAAELPFNRRLLYALGNVTYQRGDYFVAQSYFDRLLDMLDYQRIRLPVLLPNDNVQYQELGERLMMAYNNAGVVYEALAEQTGNREYRSRAMALYSESARAWDSITRDPQTMIRMRLDDVPGAPGINLGYLNANNALRPVSDYRPEIFTRIDRDYLEPSIWEQLGPFAGF